MVAERKNTAYLTFAMPDRIGRWTEGRIKCLTIQRNVIIQIFAGPCQPNARVAAIGKVRLDPKRQGVQFLRYSHSNRASLPGTARFGARAAGITFRPARETVRDTLACARATGRTLPPERRPPPGSPSARHPAQPHPSPPPPGRTGRACGLPPRCPSQSSPWRFPSLTIPKALRLTAEELCERMVHLLRDLRMPDLGDHAVDVPSPGVPGIGDTHVLGRFLRDMVRLKRRGLYLRQFPRPSGSEASEDRRWDGSRWRDLRDGIHYSSSAPWPRRHFLPTIPLATESRALTLRRCRRPGA